jgi:hypothetical protein
VKVMESVGFVSAWVEAGSAIYIGREPRSILGRVFSFKLRQFYSKATCVYGILTASSRVKNSAQGLSC